MNRFNQKLLETAQNQAADVLLDSAIEFLIRNGISRSQIHSRLGRKGNNAQHNSRKNAFMAFARAYENMGSVLSTWFDSPMFLNDDGSPAPLRIRSGQRCIGTLIKKSKVRISVGEAIDLLKRSPSVRFEGENQVIALRRVFVLPQIELARAALVVPRYLDTLYANSFAYRSGTVKLLERQCSATKINLKSITPILRSIKEQGASFVDSIDVQLEGSSMKRRGKSANSDLGLVVFAWTNTRTSKKPKHRIKRATTVT